MTELEARQKAEAFLSDNSGGRFQLRPEHATYKFGLKCYMQCYADMTSGEPDGWLAWHPKEGWLNTAGMLYLSHAFKDALEELQDYLWEDYDAKEDGEFVPWARNQGWQILPVKLLRVKE